MNFDDAIKAHASWKMKLSAYIAKPDGTLKAQDVCLDNRCDLGKWIYGEGKQYEKLPEYSVLRDRHADFHKAAAEVIKKVDAGGNVSEEVQIGSSSPFASASTAVTKALMAMKQKSK